MKPTAKIEFGDYQTPLGLAREVCSLLVEKRVEAGTVVEPTCGVGAFLVAASEAFPEAKLIGWDINANHVALAGATLASAGLTGRASLGQRDFFTHDWVTELASLKGPLLILGNPPWVTNAAVSSLNGSNLPAKENFQGLRGIQARTGKSNFDISEWMLIQLVNALRGKNATIAMLCKTATARKLLRFAWRNDGRIRHASLYRINAKQHFGAAVDACLLLARTGKHGPTEADVFETLQARSCSTTIGIAGRDLVSDIRTYERLRHLEGFGPYQWRSGVKHDCASVMELGPTSDGELENKLGQRVRIEPDCLFPLLKCSDLANRRLEPRRLVLLTQRRVGEDTTAIAQTAPRTWSYLQSHRERFEARKSSIYRNGVPFALFGVGDYSFTQWKVAVSGLHRKPGFALVGPFNGKPVLFDDTCYFLPFANEREAQVVCGILNSEVCQQFLACFTFLDSKRPITAELLQRLNLQALAEECGLAEEWVAARNHVAGYPGPAPSLQAEFVMEQPRRSPR